MLSNAGERRFQGMMSEDYRIVMMGIPHLAEIDQKVVEAIYDYNPVNLQDPLKVLEIGCGNGRATAKIVSSRPDIRLIGIDNEPEFVKQAQHTLWEAIEKVLTIIESDALAYLRSVSENCFDIVVSVLTLRNFLGSCRNEVLTTIFRALKPQGLFVNGDKYPPDDPFEFYEVLQEHMAPFLDVLGSHGRFDLLKRLVLHELADFAPDRIMKEKDSLRTMSEIGYCECKIVYRKNCDAVLLGYKR
jgi:tRNA (cmo5U34)-methyltransferase